MLVIIQRIQLLFDKIFFLIMVYLIRCYFDMFFIILLPLMYAAYPISMSPLNEATDKFKVNNILRACLL